MPRCILQPIFSVVLLAVLGTSLPPARAQMTQTPTVQRPQAGVAVVPAAPTLQSTAPRAFPIPEPNETPTSIPARSSLPTTDTLDLTDLPLAFIPNAGQADAGVRFQARSVGGSVSFTPGAVIFDLPVAEQPDPAFDPAQSPNLPHRDRDTPPLVNQLRLRFVDANAATAITGTERLPGIANYLVSDDPTDWRTNLPTYAGLVYEQLYPGVDLLYAGTEGRLKSTYIVAPHTDASRIRWRYDGASDVQLDDAGNLRITLPTPAISTTATITPAVLIEQAPIAWQVIAGQRTPISVRYAIAGDGSISFGLGAYDASQPVIIDPTLLYSAYVTGRVSIASRGSRWMRRGMLTSPAARPPLAAATTSLSPS